MITEEQIAQQLGRLPTLPSSYYRIVQLADRESSSAADFEEAMRPDPALTANVLRLANSALFGMPRSIASIRHAVAMLGTRRVVQAALGAAMHKIVPDELPGYGMDSGEYWRHSVAVAVYTTQIAKNRSHSDPGIAFTSGLLHDIGKLMAGAFLAENLDDIVAKMREEDNAFVTAEQLVMGIDHTKVGMLVADRWQLPHAITSVARYHHSPSEATDDCVLVDMVHIADCLAHGMGYGTDIGELSRSIDESAMVRLGLTSRELERVACEALSEIDDLATSLGQKD